MSLLWVIVWLLSGHPAVEPYNAWLVALVITLAFDGVWLVVVDDGDWF